MVFLLDATLREGAQSPAARFTRRRQLAILRGLAAVGIAEAEIGCAARDADLAGLVRSARRVAPSLRLSVWCRGLPADIALAASCRADVVHVSLPASDLHLRRRLGKDRDWLLRRVVAAADEARRVGAAAVALGLEDATRAAPAVLVALAGVARAAGYCRLRLADTVSAAAPARMAELVRMVRSVFDGPVGVHCHDDFGMATGNAVAAIEAGASWADGCLLGGGERAGTSRTEVLAAWLDIHGVLPLRIEALPALCRRAASALGRRMDPFSPVVGSGIWRVSSGLHVDGLGKDPSTYEPFDPARVGAQRHLLLGAQSGRGAVRQVCLAHGCEPDEAELAQLVAAVRGGACDPDDIPSLLAKLRQEG